MDFVVVNDNVVSFSINSWLAVLITAAIGYLLGSTNWAIIITRLFAHEDIRKMGSGNAGATNVLRSQGAFLAILTLIGDVGKGVLAAFAGGWIMSWVQLSPGDSPLLTYESLILVGQYIAGLFVVIGHLYPVFHGFRGGIKQWEQLTHAGLHISIGRNHHAELLKALAPHQLLLESDDFDNLSAIYDLASECTGITVDDLKHHVATNIHHLFTAQR